MCQWYGFSCVSLRVWGMALAVVGLMGCASTPTHQIGGLNEALGPLASDFHAASTLSRQASARAANRAFNTAIATDMQNSALHTANALAYQIRTRQGESDLYPLAETGFLIALEQSHDAHDAALQLAHLYLEQKQFSKSQLAAVYALRLEHDHIESLQLLAAASYYLGDVEIALWAVQRLRTLAPTEQLTWQLSVMIYGAAGLTETALELLELGNSPYPNPLRQRFYSRIRHWQSAHQPNGFGQLHVSSPVSVQPTLALTMFDDEQQRRPLVYDWSDCQQRVNELQELSGLGYGGETVGAAVDETALLPSLPSPCLGLGMPQMAIIDVVILRTNQSQSGRQGVDLLNNLAVTVQNTSSRVITQNTGESASASTTSIRNIGLGTSAGGAISYSLGIANVTEQTTEVVARPSLLVLDRQPAQFFSGASIAVGLAGSDSGGSSFYQINVGVSLSVTPTFIDEQQLLLNVRAARTFFEPITNSSTFAQSVQTSRNMVSAASSVRINETLILSGLIEDEAASGEAGVPVLKRVPGLKNLFSVRSQQSFKKSVLILITPRNIPNYYETLQAVSSDAKKAPEEDGIMAQLRQLARLEIDQQWPGLTSDIANMSPAERAFNTRSNDIQLADWLTSERMQEILNAVAKKDPELGLNAR